VAARSSATATNAVISGSYVVASANGRTSLVRRRTVCGWERPAPGNDTEPSTQRLAVSHAKIPPNSDPAVASHRRMKSCGSPNRCLNGSTSPYLRRRNLGRYCAIDASVLDGNAGSRPSPRRCHCSVTVSTRRPSDPIAGRSLAGAMIVSYAFSGHAPAVPPAAPGHKLPIMQVNDGLSGP
jgi:hypothetical protein